MKIMKHTFLLLTAFFLFPAIATFQQDSSWFTVREVAKDVWQNRLPVSGQSWTVHVSRNHMNIIQAMRGCVHPGKPGWRLILRIYS